MAADRGKLRVRRVGDSRDDDGDLGGRPYDRLDDLDGEVGIKTIDGVAERESEGAWVAAHSQCYPGCHCHSTKCVQPGAPSSTHETAETVTPESPINGKMTESDTVVIAHSTG